MKFRNPARHYPSYLVHVYLKDGRKLNVRGSCKPEISIPMDEEDVLVIVVKIVNASREVALVRLLVDGEWSDYSEEALKDILVPPMTMPKPCCDGQCEVKMCDEAALKYIQDCKLKSKLELETKTAPNSGLDEPSEWTAVEDNRDSSDE